MHGKQACKMHSTHRLANGDDAVTLMILPAESPPWYKNYTNDKCKVPPDLLYYKYRVVARADIGDAVHWAALYAGLLCSVRLT